MTGTVRILVGCQVQACAEETSYPLDMVAMFNGEPICQQCYEDAADIDVLADEDGKLLTAWAELPAISLEDLRR